ncbi:hypothetical protein LTR56_018300 [Elasticomyces elasticus]|nr:hypothetical protein LTR56_018300 [Elasticomyces elasticus]KAK3636790.1 hypothetical protein LTR22_018605 [Elasticomyces elasticus]KAK4912347.1 hypothetical protein LTR49_019165 [Elasticomyces elasticus]KAK5751859.1 hypothetical protein LTS12_018100 [Elasticomyces elasticus]
MGNASSKRQADTRGSTPIPGLQQARLKPAITKTASHAAAAVDAGPSPIVLKRPGQVVPTKRRGSVTVDNSSHQAKKARHVEQTQAQQTPFVVAEPLESFEQQHKRPREQTPSIAYEAPSKRPKLTEKSPRRTSHIPAARHTQADRIPEAAKASDSTEGEKGARPSVSDPGSDERAVRHISLLRRKVGDPKLDSLLRQGARYIKGSQQARQVLSIPPSALLAPVGRSRATRSETSLKVAKRIKTDELQWPTVGVGTWQGSHAIPGSRNRCDENYIDLPSFSLIRRASGREHVPVATVAGSHARARLNGSVVRPLQLPPLAGPEKQPRRALKRSDVPV